MSYESTERYTGKFQRCLYRSEDSGYSVCIFSGNTVVGTDLPELPFPVTFLGKWVNAEKYGRQFQADMIANQLPTQPDDIISFVATLHIGIGRKTVRKMLGQVPAERFWDTVCNSSSQFAALVKPEPLRKLQKKAREMALMQDLIALFQNDIKLDVPRYKRICSVFRDQLSRLTAMIQENPFILIEAGIPFSELDQFAAARTDIPADDPRRLLGAAQQIILDAQEQCHSCVPAQALLQELVKRLEKNGSVPVSELKKFINAAVMDQELFYKRSRLYLPRSFEEETVIVETAMSLRKIPDENISLDGFQNAISEYEREKGFSLSQDQRNAVWTAITRSICIITGGPGTGKSTILDAVRFCWERFFQDSEILLLAPTGRAAVRMTEATGYPASTIHSLLRLDTEFSSFRRMQNSENLIQEELVIVDESSMMDQSVAASLLGALSGYTNGRRQHFILVGDPDQLPSVSYGNVLADFINSGVLPVCALNTVYRQAADNPIIHNSIAIREGNTNLTWDAKFKHFDFGSDKANMEAVCKFYQKCAVHYGVENVALLSPYHVKTEISTNVLNKMLQDMVNPDKGQPSMKSGRRIYRLNDRVMMLKNTETLNNGDIGFVSDVYQDSESSDTNLVVTFENGVTQCFSREDLFNLELAYAMSIHKAQGSQYHTVIIVLPDNPTPFLRRNLIYTGITRAKENVAIFGPKRVLAYSIQNNTHDLRTTGLVSRLQKD